MRMRAEACAFVLLLTGALGRKLQQEEEFIVVQPDLSSLQDIDTVFSLGGDQAGDVQITGILQNFALDRDPINTLLNRPSTSYLDVSWSNWVDQRLELLDLFQSLMAPPSRPSCAHMQSLSAMDNGMVSYLASSRFGPAILTTYSQQAGEEQADFDYDSVNIPASRPLQRSYEDASLQEEMSADADKAFEMAALESRMLSQESNLGYFGANMKKQMLYGQLDGDSESLQPVIRTHPNLLNLVESHQDAFLAPLPEQEVDVQEDVPIDRKQLAVFCLLLVGCCYVWTSLIVSCVQMKRQADDRGAESKNASDLLVPLVPEKASSLGEVKIAADYPVAGDFGKPLTA